MYLRFNLGPLHLSDGLINEILAFDANKTYLRVGTDPNSKVKKIDGKGLGWVANKDIKRGSVIFTENPQLELSLDSSVGNQSCKI